MIHFKHLNKVIIEKLQSKNKGLVDYIKESKNKENDGLISEMQPTQKNITQTDETLIE